MSPMETPQPTPHVPRVNHNDERWAVFHKNEKEAKEALKKITDKLSEKYLIVKASCTFVAKFHDGNIYNIHIVKAPRTNS